MFLNSSPSYEEVKKQLQELEDEYLRMKKMYEKERDEKEKLLSDFNGRLVSTNSQFEDCRRLMNEKNVSPHKLLSNLHSMLKFINSQLCDLRFSLENNISSWQKGFPLKSCNRSQNLKRRKEGEYFSKKKSKKTSSNGKISIFIHVVGDRDADEYETVSQIYKIEMESDKYRNPSPPLMSFLDRRDNIRCYSKVGPKSEPGRIKPVFNFTFKEGYPLGMACVHFGSKHHLYLMGGSITYSLFLTKSGREAYKLYESVNTTDPNMYPPDVYVLDCFTCQLVSPQNSPPPMNSGKSANPFTFVENGKLYVLSSSTKVPKELHMFEVFDPDLRTWTILNDPPYDWGNLYSPLGSVLIDGVFFVSYAQDNEYDTPVHIFSYKIANKEWNKTLSVHRPYRSLSVVPSFERDSVFVQNKIYSANVRELIQTNCFYFPILSYGPIPTPAKLDAHDFDAMATPNLTPIYPWDACWPIYDRGMEGRFSARLVHLGGLLDGTKNDTTCFGFVQVAKPVGDGGCYIRFDAFEAFNYEITCDSDTYKDAANLAAASKSSFRLPEECVPFFRAKTLHACYYYSSGNFQRCRLNAVCALVLS